MIPGGIYGVRLAAPLPHSQLHEHTGLFPSLTLTLFFSFFFSFSCSFFFIYFLPKLARRPSVNLAVPAPCFWLPVTFSILSFAFPYFFRECATDEKKRPSHLDVSKERPHGSPSLSLSLSQCEFDLNEKRGRPFNMENW